jgi:hypothetical protein
MHEGSWYNSDVGRPPSSTRRAVRGCHARAKMFEDVRGGKAAQIGGDELAAKGSVWAITAYFDPLCSQRRLKAYREFRRNLGVPLATVELSYRDGFDLGPEDADILISLRGGAVLWQKERLLNIALRALPATCDTVAWVDCDTVFLRDDWHSAAREMLNEFALIQPFHRLYYLESTEAPVQLTSSERAEPFDSIASRYAHRKLPDQAFTRVGSSIKYKYAPGMAWVARRDLLERCGGLYDADILGFCDKLIFAAACGKQNEVVRAAALNPHQRRHYASWAERFHQAVQGRISYVTGDLMHLWHGDFANRRYAERRNGFDRFAFDPETDIRRNADGVWCWGSDKPDMHSFLRKQFESMEGTEVSETA